MYGQKSGKDKQQHTKKVGGKGKKWLKIISGQEGDNG